MSTRRARWVGVTGAVLTAYVGIVTLVPLPFVALGPGPTYDVIGSHDGTQVIVVKGRPTYPTDGQLLMTTVSQRGGPFGGLTAAQSLFFWRSPAAKVLPQEDVFPPQQSVEEIRDEGKAAFVDSQQAAVAAAADHLGLPVREHVSIGSVVASGPSATALRPGDILTSIDARSVSTPEDVSKALQSTIPGRTAQLEIRRDGKAVTASVVLGTSPVTAGKGYLGVTLGTTYDTPLDVDFTLQQVGGPSAGAMFALGLVDELTPGSLTAGRIIAGTGTITATGDVGAIGGIAQKMFAAREAGATLFLAPDSNCDEVVGAIPDGLTVAAVRDLDGAIAAVDAYRVGRSVPVCRAP